MAEAANGEIFVVDDDPAVRDMLSIVLGTAGYNVICFADGPALLAAARSRSPVCILLDINIPGRSGIDILKDLRSQQYAAPIFMISGVGDIAIAVDAIKSGALDFIEKPFRGNDIVERIRRATAAVEQRERRATPINFPGREPLTRREQEVLDLVANGSSNKEAGRELGISPRTVEDHRANIMKKLGVHNSTELLRLVLTSAR
jgi:FixJ family two-component response regulator